MPPSIWAGEHHSAQSRGAGIHPGRSARLGGRGGGLKVNNGFRTIIWRGRKTPIPEQSKAMWTPHVGPPTGQDFSVQGAPGQDEEQKCHHEVQNPS